jgi:hypothetical protein
MLSLTAADRKLDAAGDAGARQADVFVHHIDRSPHVLLGFGALRYHERGVHAGFKQAGGSSQNEQTQRHGDH